jgi:riboflavin synthase
LSPSTDKRGVFTGIVEEVGTVAEAAPFGEGRAFRISAVTVLEGLRPGDSVAVDGACHTVTTLDSSSFSIQSVLTTLQRTTVGDFATGRKVNLERALAIGDRLGGHLVQGHVDAVGEVVRIEHRGEHVLMDIRMPPSVEEVTILHGSITVNGVSLTVNALPEPATVQVSIIPHTWQVTNFPQLEVGSRVNLEGDLIGKYVRQLVGRPRDAAGADAEAEHLRRRLGY